MKPGDLLLFGKIGCRVVAGDRGRALPPAARAGANDMGSARAHGPFRSTSCVAFSGPTFGKVYALVGAIGVCGRSGDERHLHSDRRDFAPARPSAQCCQRCRRRRPRLCKRYLCQRQARVHTPTQLQPGDEVRFDTIRFLPMSPALEAQHASAAAHADVNVIPSRSSRGLWIVAGIDRGARCAAVAWLRYLGKI